MLLRQVQQLGIPLQLEATMEKMKTGDNTQRSQQTISLTTTQTRGGIDHIAIVKNNIAIRIAGKVSRYIDASMHRATPIIS